MKGGSAIAGRVSKIQNFWMLSSKVAQLQVTKQSLLPDLNFPNCLIFERDQKAILYFRLFIIFPKAVFDRGLKFLVAPIDSAHLGFTRPIDL